MGRKDTHCAGDGDEPAAWARPDPARLDVPILNGQIQKSFKIPIGGKNDEVEWRGHARWWPTFHFAAITHERRIAFFEGITNTHFYFAVSAFRKDDHDRRGLTKSVIHEATVDGLVRHLKEWYLFAEEGKVGNAGLNEKIVYDECQDVQYVRTLKTSFRTLKSSRGSNKKLVDDVRPGKSKSDGCLQLADMVLGAVGRHLDGDNVYYDYIRSRMIGISFT